LYAAAIVERKSPDKGRKNPTEIVGFRPEKMVEKKGLQSQKHLL
jgi:hypothetical protein